MRKNCYRALCAGLLGSLALVGFWWTKDYVRGSVVLRQASLPVTNIADCSLYADTFDTAYTMIQEEFAASMRATAWVQQAFPFMVEPHKQLLHTFYTGAVEHNPTLACAAAFLRQQGTAIPYPEVSSLLVRLYFAQRGVKDLVEIGGKL